MSDDTIMNSAADPRREKLRSGEVMLTFEAAHADIEAAIIAQGLDTQRPDGYNIDAILATIIRATGDRDVNALPVAEFRAIAERYAMPTRDEARAALTEFLEHRFPGIVARDDYLLDSILSEVRLGVGNFDFAAIEENYFLAILDRSHTSEYLYRQEAAELVETIATEGD